MIDQKTKMITDKALEHINSITPEELTRYTTYFRNITPQDHIAKFKRYIFAFASVHTSWLTNCKTYRALEDLKWLGSREELKRRLIASGAGMHNNRTEYMTEFSMLYWVNPGWFDKLPTESWRTYRNRIMEMIPGLGTAKAAFTLELNHPLETDIVCTDVHFLRLYGQTNAGVTPKVSDRIEDHWAESCKLWNVPPTLARWVYWDRLMGYKDSRYWSIVLEGPQHGSGLA